jgi:hypothetical protein
MRFKYYIGVIVFLFINSSCYRKAISQNDNNKDISTLNIMGDIYNRLQYDSIFLNIKAIPLETNEHCLISSIEKSIIYDDNIFIQDRGGKLLVFNISGKYLYDIGSQGRGPNEYFELRDFDIDNDGTIYILDYQKIHIWDKNRRYSGSIPFNLWDAKHKIQCNPFQFAVSSNNDFFMWGGTFSLTESPKWQQFAMYEMNKQGKVIKSFFPVKHVIIGGKYRFKKFEKEILIDPVFGSNTIYTIKNSNLLKKYEIDFGDKTLKIPIPEGFNSLSEFKSKIDRQYYHSISAFTETENWVFFMFTYKMHNYNVYFRKQDNKSFLSDQWPLAPGKISPWMIYTTYRGNLISFCEPKYLLDQIEACDINKSSSKQKELIIALSQLKLTDNPVFLICKTINKK